MMDKYQPKDKELSDKIKLANNHTKYPYGGRKFMQLICRSDKILVPKIHQNCAVNWNHMYLLNLGMDNTDTTISQ